MDDGGEVPQLSDPSGGLRGCSGGPEWNLHAKGQRKSRSVTGSGSDRSLLPAGRAGGVSEPTLDRVLSHRSPGAAARGRMPPGPGPRGIQEAPAVPDAIRISVGTPRKSFSRRASLCLGQAMAQTRTGRFVLFQEGIGKRPPPRHGALWSLPRCYWRTRRSSPGFDLTAER